MGDAHGLSGRAGLACVLVMVSATAAAAPASRGLSGEIAAGFDTNVANVRQGGDTREDTFLQLAAIAETGWNLGPGMAMQWQLQLDAQGYATAAGYHTTVWGLAEARPAPGSSLRRRRPPALPEHDASAEMQAGAEALLAQAGYAHYETSAFARCDGGADRSGLEKSKPQRSVSRPRVCTTQPGAVFFGMPGHTYEFRSRAIDVVGVEDQVEAVAHVQVDLVGVDTDRRARGLARLVEADAEFDKGSNRAVDLDPSATDDQARGHRAFRARVRRAADRAVVDDGRVVPALPGADRDAARHRPLVLRRVPPVGGLLARVHPLLGGDGADLQAPAGHPALRDRDVAPPLRRRARHPLGHRHPGAGALGAAPGSAPL